MHERTRFAHWLGAQVGRVTGWMAWCASLEARGAVISENGRRAFDDWLAEVNKDDKWTLYHAWAAAAKYAEGHAGAAP